MNCEKNNNIVIDIIGFTALLILSLRLIPPTLLSIYSKKKVDIENTFLFMEFLGCILYIIYGNYYNIQIIIHTNSLILGSVVSICFYNKYHNFAIKQGWRKNKLTHKTEM